MTKRSVLARRARTAAKRKVYAEARAACRKKVYARDGGCCVVCGIPLVLSAADASHEFQIAHIHEKKPRSLGGDPLDPDNCETRCYLHHAEAHGIRCANAPESLSVMGRDLPSGGSTGEFD